MTTTATRLLPDATTTTTGGRNRTVAIAAAIVAGLVLAYLWSARLVDDLGVESASAVLGENARESAIGGWAVGAVFAFVSGVAGTFTACNVAVFGALPAMRSEAAAGGRLSAVARPVGWLSLGLLGVAAVYGFIAVLLGDRLPQLSTAVVGRGMPERLIQSIVVFGLIGLAFAYLGLAATGAVPDVFAGRPRARLVVLGALMGGFLVGRPYPLFHKLLEQAASTHQPFYGSLVMCLQAIGNILLIALIMGVLALVRRPRADGAPARTGRLAMITGITLLAFGTFLVVYWGVRLPAYFGYGWFPTAPWNG